MICRDVHKLSKSERNGREDNLLNIYVMQEVPEEPYWVTITKYIMYSISGILLILYCIIIIYSR